MNTSRLKKSYFDDCQKRLLFALVNDDDKRRSKDASEFVKATHSDFCPKSSPAGFKGKIISNTLEGLELRYQWEVDMVQNDRFISMLTTLLAVAWSWQFCWAREEGWNPSGAISDPWLAKGRFDRIEIRRNYRHCGLSHLPLML